MTRKSDWDQTYEGLKRLNWLILLALSCIGYLLTGYRGALGIILGGMLAIFNFNFFQNSIKQAILIHEKDGAGMLFLIVKSFLRLLALGVAVFLLINSPFISFVGVIIGLSTVFLGITGLGIKNAWIIRIREQVR
ncbi:MAG: ATP synthase subunit I [Deltaproteobacteria bacterium]|nr:ATP synthase subunit I [Deltaproteobacteria bacterium]MBW1914916.1 ATP synthase subunit I [Deltaproteobacteria bacterium]